MSVVVKSAVTTNAVMTGAVRRVFVVIALLALSGIVVSSLSLYHHYGTSKTNYCDFGESFNCHGRILRLRLKPACLKLIIF